MLDSCRSYVGDSADAGQSLHCASDSLHTEVEFAGEGYKMMKEARFQKTIVAINDHGLASRRCVAPFLSISFFHARVPGV